MWSQVKSKLVLTFSTIGIISFSLFILEEAYQTTMFGIWPAKDVHNYAHVKAGVELMEKITSAMNIVNNCVGCINPLGFVSYRSFVKAARFHTASVRLEAFANAPELFVGERMAITFHPSAIETQSGGTFVLSRGRIRAVATQRPENKFIKVNGIVSAENGKILIK